MLESSLVLIVDDDCDLREELETFLNRYGVKTVNAANAVEAKRILLKENVSLVIADIIMPGESGLALTTWIRKNKSVPIILLTALDDVVDRVAGLELGADDYIVKPFSPRELLARVKAVLRRSTDIKRIDQVAHMYELNMHDELTGTLIGKKKLRPTEANLLRVLVANEGSSVSRQQLYSEVLAKDWNPEDRRIDNIIARLRSFIEPDPTNPKVIHTIRHKGYLIISGKVKIEGVKTS